MHDQRKEEKKSSPTLQFICQMNRLKGLGPTTPKCESRLTIGHSRGRCVFITVFRDEIMVMTSNLPPSPIPPLLKYRLVQQWEDGVFIAMLYHSFPSLPQTLFLLSWRQYWMGVARKRNFYYYFLLLLRCCCSFKVAIESFIIESEQKVALKRVRQ